MFRRGATGLVRELGLLDMFVIAMANINIVGGFVIDLVLAPSFFPGASLAGIFLIAAIPGIALVVIYSIFSSAMPRAGGDYIWTARFNGRLGSIMGISAILAGAVGALVYQSYYFVSFSLAQLFFSLGATTNNSGLMSLAAQISVVPDGFIVSVLFALAVTAIAIFGVRLVKHVTNYAFIVYAIGMFIFVAALLSLNKSTFPSVFDGIMSSQNVTYASIQGSVAQNPSWTQFSLYSTLLGALPLGYFSFYGGFNLNTYLVGETKRVSSTVPKSLILALLTALVFGVGMSFAVTSVFGTGFLSAISNLYTSGKLTGLPVEPSANLLVSLASPPWLGFLVNFDQAIGFFLLALVYMMMYSKVIFAMSFDRLVPAKLSEVNDRFHSPHWAIVALAAVGLVMSTLFWYGGFVFAWLNTAMIFPLISIVPCIAAFLYPLRKSTFKQNFSSLQGWMGWKLGSWPLISIGGLAGIGLFGFDFFSLVYPITSFSYLGTSLNFALGLLAAIIAAGLILYEGQRYYLRTRKKLDIKMVFSQIPPE